MAFATSRVVRDTDVAREMSAAIAEMLAFEETPPNEEPGKKKRQRGRFGSGSKLRQAVLEAASGGKVRKNEVARQVQAVVRRSMSDAYDIVVSAKVDPAAVRLLESLNDIVSLKRTEMSERNLELLVEAMLPANDPMAAVRSKIETDNAKARVRFMKEVPCLASTDLADLAGHSARNRSVTGSRWKAEGKVFSVQIGGRELYPAFQFRDGKPDPAIAKVLAALPRHMTPWQIAFWFSSSNPWLDGSAPAEKLNEPEAVVNAARSLAEAPAG